MINATYFPNMWKYRYMERERARERERQRENVAKYEQLVNLSEVYMGILSIFLWV